MRTVIRYLALSVALAALVTWGMTGAHRGWTQTSVATRELDEVTGLESVRYERRFVAGLDLLGLALAGAGGLACLSLAFPARRAGAGGAGLVPDFSSTQPSSAGRNDPTEHRKP